MVEKVIKQCSKKLRVPYYTIPFSQKDALISLNCPSSLTSDGSGTFEVIGITKAVFDLCADLAAKNPGCERVMLLHSDGVRLTPWHLLQLSNKLDSDPDAEIVTSWITQLRRLPMLFTLDFVRGIDSRKLDEGCPERNCLGRPLPNLPLTDVVYGDERLESNITIPARLEAFMHEHTISALEAVHLARQLKMGGSKATGSVMQPKSKAWSRAWTNLTGCLSSRPATS